MSEAKIGIRSGNAVIPYAATTKKTKWIDFSTFCTSNKTGDANLNSLVRFTADSSGKWYMEFNICRSFQAGNFLSITVTVANVVTKSAANVEHAITGLVYDNSVNVGTTIATYAESGNGNFNVILAAALTNASRVAIAGRVELNAEPTTYTIAANMEGMVTADIYIAPASAGTAGLVNNLAGNTVGTPIKGKTDGVAVDTGYVGQTIVVAASSVVSTSSSVAIVATYSLPQGTYLILAYDGFIHGTRPTSGVTSVEFDIYDSSASSVLSRIPAIAPWAASSTIGDMQRSSTSLHATISFTGTNKTIQFRMFGSYLSGDSTNHTVTSYGNGKMTFVRIA